MQLPYNKCVFIYDYELNIRSYLLYILLDISVTMRKFGLIVMLQKNNVYVIHM